MGYVWTGFGMAHLILLCHRSVGLVYSIWRFAGTRIVYTVYVNDIAGDAEVVEHSRN